jgi:hypothetical protein
MDVVGLVSLRFIVCKVRPNAKVSVCLSDILGAGFKTWLDSMVLSLVYEPKPSSWLVLQCLCVTTDYRSLNFSTSISHLSMQPWQFSLLLPMVLVAAQLDLGVCLWLHHVYVMVVLDFCRVMLISLLFSGLLIFS